MKIDNNISCPFCGQKVKEVKKLELRRINSVMMPILELQGLEIRKKNRLKNNPK